jgi:hypothetical protein
MPWMVQRCDCGGLKEKVGTRWVCPPCAALRKPHARLGVAERKGRKREVALGKRSDWKGR